MNDTVTGRKTRQKTEPVPKPQGKRFWFNVEKTDSEHQGFRLLDLPSYSDLANHVIICLSFPSFGGGDQGCISAHRSVNKNLSLSTHAGHDASFFEDKCRSDMFCPRGLSSCIINTRIMILKTLLSMLLEDYVKWYQAGS